jgi:probable HAF family extracellular repeat protein
MLARLSISAATAVFALSTASMANPLGFTPIPDDPGTAQTAAEAINDAGQIVGQAAVNPASIAGPVHSFLFSGGSFTNFDITATNISAAFGINNHSGIVGGYEQPVFSGKAYAGTLGHFVTITPPGSAGTGDAAVGINDAGVIVGGYTTTPGGPSHGFIDNGGTFMTFDVPGATSTRLTGINNLGQLAGFYQSGGVTNGFETDTAGNVILTIPGVGGDKIAINDFGQIVGTMGNTGFVDTAGTILLISVDGAGLTEVTGINDVGQIVGFYTTPNAHSFIATAPAPAVPEPSGIALLTPGVLVLWLIAIRRRATVKETLPSANRQTLQPV